MGASANDIACCSNVRNKWVLQLTGKHFQQLKQKSMNHLQVLLKGIGDGNEGCGDSGDGYDPVGPFSRIRLLRHPTPKGTRSMMLRLMMLMTMRPAALHLRRLGFRSSTWGLDTAFGWFVILAIEACMPQLMLLPFD